MIGLVYAFAHTFTWAVSSVFLRVLSTKVDAFLINGLRGLTALFVVIPIALITGTAEDFRLLFSVRLVYLTSSVLVGGVIGSVCYINSLKLLGVTRAFPVLNGHPIFTIFFSYLLIHEPVNWPIIPGALLVLSGVYLISRSKKALPVQARPAVNTKRLSESVTSANQLLKGLLYALTAALLWGISTVIFAIGIEGINGPVANIVRMPVMIIASLSIAAARGKIRLVRYFDLKTVLLVIFNGLIAGGLGSTLWALSIQHAGPSKTAIISANAPFLALPISVLFFHEKVTRIVIAGTVLAVAGIVLVVGF